MPFAPRRLVPVLTAIALFAGGATSAEPPAKSAEPPARLAVSAKAVLTTHCYRCHGKDGANEGGLGSVLDRRRLVESKLVAPGDAPKSRLLRRVTAGEMPPPEEKVKLPAADIDTLKQWVAAGAPDWSAPVARKAIALADEIRFTAADLAKQKTAPGARPMVMYFSLTPLYNAGAPEDELEDTRVGFFKLLNSFSARPTIVLPEAINPEKTVYRIELEAFGRSGLGVDGHPFGLTMRLPENRDSEAQAPFRMDWFVTAAARADLYHQNAGIPLTLKQLEGRLKVAAEDNVRAATVIRSGFNGSGVSRHNRLIERHEGAHGYYWRSYDFAGSKGRQNLFAFPAGPGPSAAQDTFTHDGGEIIFRLPNGLHGYMLVDGRGNRLERGPTDIVSDPKHPEKVVETGRSCMSCHAGGLLDKADQLRPLVEQPDVPFSKATRTAILALHPPREKFGEAVRADTADYRKALEKLGAKADAPDPVSTTARRYEAELDLRRAAAELWVTPEKLQTALKALPADSKIRAGVLPLLAPGGAVKRDAFESLFAALVRTTSPDVTTHYSLPIPTLPKSRLLAAEPGAPYRTGSRTVTTNKTELTIDPTFRLVASVTKDGTRVELRDLPTNELRYTLAPQVRVFQITFSPDGSVLAASGQDQAIRFTDTLTGKELGQTKERSGPPNGAPLAFWLLAFSPDGTELAAAAGDGPIRYFDPTSGKLVRSVGKANFHVPSLAYLPDGRLLKGDAVADPKTDNSKALPKGDRIGRLLAVSPDGKRIAAATVTNAVSLYDAATLDQIAEERVSFVAGPANPTSAPGVAVTFSPDGEHLVVAHQGGFMTVWTSPGLKLVRAVRCDSDQVTALRFTPDGKRLAAPGTDGVIRFWDWAALRKADD